MSDAVDNDTPVSNPASKPKAPAVDPDLSNEIERAVEKDAHDRVRCVRVFERVYRCNWWAPAPVSPGGSANATGYTWSVAATHRVRKSLFLSATLASGQLVIQEVAKQPS